MTERELLQRTKQFALRIFKLVGVFPQTIQGRAVAAQLIRSGTSVAANYRAACRARSKPEFIAKLGVVEEEADESAFWLELIIGTGLLSAAGYGACRVAVAKDHNMFGILFLWATTKGRASRNALYWRGSSVSPFPVRPTRKPAEVIYYV